MSKTIAFISLLFFGLNVLSQVKIQDEISIYYAWIDETQLSFQADMINYYEPFLLNLKISKKDKPSQSIFTKDSILVTKGLFHKKFILSLNEENFNDSSLTLIIHWNSISKGKFQLNQEKVLAIKSPKIKPIKMIVKDSALFFEHCDRNTLLTLNSFSDSLFSNPLYSSSIQLDNVINDSLDVFEIVESEKLKDQWIVIELSNSKQESYKDTLYYQLGNLFKWEKSSNNLYRTEPIRNDSLNEKKNFSGTIDLETNFFHTKPIHANGNQFPYTRVSTSNSVDLLGLPFQFDASHTTNENISNNFRNFLSIQFDMQEYKQRMAQKIADNQAKNFYSPELINKDIQQNDQIIKKLRKSKSIANKFPEEKHNANELATQQMHQSEMSLKRDSLFGLDTMPSSEINTKDISGYSSIDSKIEKLEQSNALKRNYLNQSKSINIEPTNNIDPTEFKEQLLNAGIPTFFSRIQKFQIGNFYEYGGEYSLRDIEMIGINTHISLNNYNKFGVTYGRINDFQSFNLDRIENNKRLSSLVWSNDSYSFLNIALRISRFSNNKVSEELNGVQSSYLLQSINFSGDISNFAFYQSEINRSINDWDDFFDARSNDQKHMALYQKVELYPLNFLELNLRFDQVGSNYKSDGVYFLMRNQQRIALGYKLKLFKNKLYLRNDYTIIKRNFEQKNLTNQTEKLFFDVGSRFTRYPNLQITYSPVSVEIANKIDTSFSGLNGNTNVLIARLFYFKKIRKTVYNTALIYNEIENDFGENFKKQTGIQYFASLTNDKIVSSTTLSFIDSFSALRFVSISQSYIFNQKLSATLHLSKNFKEDFYKEIIRSQLNYSLNSKLRLGLGGIFLIDRNNYINTGGTVQLSIRY